MSEKICEHCDGEIAIRNPSGYCDHLYYPQNCKVCSHTKKNTEEGFVASRFRGGKVNVETYDKSPEADPPNVRVGDWRERFDEMFAEDLEDSRQGFWSELRTEKLMSFIALERQKAAEEALNDIKNKSILMTAQEASIEAQNQIFLETAKKQLKAEGAREVVEFIEKQIAIVRGETVIFNKDWDAIRIETARSFFGDPLQ